MKRMRSFYLCCLLALPQAGVRTAPEEFPLDKPSERVAAPALRGEALAGGTIDLADFKGRPLLINFWASYCMPCRREMPALVRLQKRYSKKLTILTVAADGENRKAVSDFVRKYEVELPVLLDPGQKLSKTYSVRLLPMTYVVARDGRIDGRVVGYADWESPGAIRLIEALIAAD